MLVLLFVVRLPKEQEQEPEEPAEELGPGLLGHFEEAKVLGHSLAQKETKVQELESVVESVVESVDCWEQIALGQPVLLQKQRQLDLQPENLCQMELEPEPLLL